MCISLSLVTPKEGQFMFKWLDQTTNFLLKFAYDCMKVFLIFVMLARAFYKSFNISGLFTYTAVVFLASILVSYILSSFDDLNREKFKYLGLLGIVGSLLVGIRFNPNFAFTGQMIMGGYFVVVWMNGISFITEKDNTHFFFRRFFQTFLVMLFIALSVGVGQLRWYLTALQPFYTVFFLSVIMNLVSMNLKSAYQETSANIMQKSKRVLAFNIVSIFLLTFSFLGLMLVFSNVSLGWLETLVRFALMPIAQFGSWFSRRIKERGIRNQNPNGGDSVMEWSDRIEEMHEDIQEEIPIHTDSPWDQYIEWLFVIIIIAALIGLAYYLTRRIEKRRIQKDSIELSEIRESMLSGSYIKKHFANRMGQFSDKINSLLGRKQEELPKVRMLYKAYLEYITHKGISITEDMTPNEILLRDQRKRGERKGPVRLTQIYNAYKYGAVDESKLDEADLKYIEDALENNEM